MSPTFLHTLLERLRAELDPTQHAQLSFLAGEDVVLGVVELLWMVDPGWSRTRPPTCAVPRPLLKQRAAVSSRRRPCGRAGAARRAPQLVLVERPEPEVRTEEVGGRGLDGLAARRR